VDAFRTALTEDSKWFIKQNTWARQSTVHSIITLRCKTIFLF